MAVHSERRGASDASNLDWSAAQGVAFLTFDDDLLVLAAAGTKHAGLIYCHALKYPVGALARAIVALRDDGRWPATGEVVYL